MTMRVIISDQVDRVCGNTIVLDALLHSDGKVTITKCASTLRMLCLMDRLHAALGFINTNGTEEVPA